MLNALRGNGDWGTSEDNVVQSTIDSGTAGEFSLVKVSLSCSFAVEWRLGSERGRRGPVYSFLY